MVHSTTTETPETIKNCFIAGILAADLGIDRETILEVTNINRDIYPLSNMAFYDGWVKRKHGLVDENGEEIFR